MARERTGASSFDELAVGLSSGTLSRGKALRLMGAARVGGALASIPGIAWAKPKPAGSKCKHDRQCQSRSCFNGRCCGTPCFTFCCPDGCGCLVPDNAEIQCGQQCPLNECDFVTDCSDWPLCIPTGLGSFACFRAYPPAA
jgi:hypothetical protein